MTNIIITIINIIFGILIGTLILIVCPFIIVAILLAAMWLGIIICISKDEAFKFLNKGTFISVQDDNIGPTNDCNDCLPKDGDNKSPVKNMIDMKFLAKEFTKNNTGCDDCN